MNTNFGPAWRGLAAGGALALVGATVSMSSASAADGGGSEAPSVIYHRVTLDRPVDVEDLVEFAADNGVSVSSVQHGSADSSGEMIVGDEPLATAAKKYRDTIVQNFGDEPAVISFVTASPLTPGSSVGEATVEAVVAQASASLAPIVGSGDVGVMNIPENWAPASGTTWAHNSSTGAARQVRHRMTWTSRAGLDSFKAGYVYEHDNKLIDPNSKPATFPSPAPCTEPGAYWMDFTSTWIVGTNMPSAANVYADNARYSELCGYMDISFGVFHPDRLAVNYEYRVVIGGDAGPKSSSPQMLKGQKLKNDCPSFAEYDDCVGLNTGDPGQDSTDLFLGKSRTFPGCYSWSQTADPIVGTC